MSPDSIFYPSDSSFLRSWACAFFQIAKLNCYCNQFLQGFICHELFKMSCFIPFFIEFIFLLFCTFLTILLYFSRNIYYFISLHDLLKKLSPTLLFLPLFFDVQSYRTCGLAFCFDCSWNSTCNAQRAFSDAFCLVILFAKRVQVFDTFVLAVL